MIVLIIVIILLLIWVLLLHNEVAQHRKAIKDLYISLTNHQKKDSEVIEQITKTTGAIIERITKDEKS